MSQISGRAYTSCSYAFTASDSVLIPVQCEYFALEGLGQLLNTINLVKKHVKPNGQTAGSIIEMEAPIHASNVMILDPKTKKPTRIGHSVNKDGKKIRVAKKSNSSLD